MAIRHSICALCIGEPLYNINNNNIWYGVYTNRFSYTLRRWGWVWLPLIYVLSTTTPLRNNDISSFNYWVKLNKKYVLCREKNLGCFRLRSINFGKLQVQGWNSLTLISGIWNLGKVFSKRKSLLSIIRFFVMLVCGFCRCGAVC